MRCGSHWVLQRISIFTLSKAKIEAKLKAPSDVIKCWEKPSFGHRKEPPSWNLVHMLQYRYSTLTKNAYKFTRTSSIATPWECVQNKFHLGISHFCGINKDTLLSTVVTFGIWTHTRMFLSWLTPSINVLFSEIVRFTSPFLNKNNL